MIRDLCCEPFSDPAALVEVLDDDVRGLIVDLIDTAVDEDFDALSAPEVGVNRQVLVVRVAVDGGEPTYLPMINPSRHALEDKVVVVVALDHTLSPVLYRPDAAIAVPFEESYRAMLGADAYAQPDVGTAS